MFAQRFTRQFVQSALTHTVDSVHWIKNSSNCLTYTFYVCFVNHWSDLCVMTAIRNLGHLDLGLYYNYQEVRGNLQYDMKIIKKEKESHYISVHQFCKAQINIWVWVINWNVNVRGSVNISLTKKCVGTWKQWNLTNTATHFLFLEKRMQSAETENDDDDEDCFKI